MRACVHNVRERERERERKRDSSSTFRVRGLPGPVQAVAAQRNAEQLMEQQQARFSINSTLKKLLNSLVAVSSNYSEKRELKLNCFNKKHLLILPKH